MWPQTICRPTILYDKYKDQNFVIIGFLNNFMGQEPGSNEEELSLT